MKTPDRTSPKRKSVLRSLTGWWKKKHSYYVDIHHDFQPDNGTMFQEEESLGTSTVAFQHECNNEDDEDTFDVASLHTPSPRVALVGQEPLSSSSGNGILEHKTPPPVTMITPPHSQQQQPTVPSTPRHHNMGRLHHLVHSSPPPIPESAPTEDLSLPFVSTSFSTGSLLSIDSLVDSYGGVGDNEWEDLGSGSDDQLTDGNGRVADFFAEHVTFLRIQTKPRRVEVVWADEKPVNNIA